MIDLFAGLRADRHPMHSADAAREIIALLPATDMGRTLGEVSRWLRSVGESAEFKPRVRQEVTGLRLDIEADRFQQPLPNPWEKIHVVYTITGQVERQKAERAVTLSIEKYCSASETLRLAGATITWEVALPDGEPG